MQYIRKQRNLLRTPVSLQFTSEAANMPMYVQYFGNLLHSSVRLIEQLR
jgi:hypothetical protein